MTAITERIPLDEITAQAREVHPGRTILTVIAAFFFALGWLTAKTFAVLWLALAWSAVAIREGWREAQVSRGPSQPG